MRKKEVTKVGEDVKPVEKTEFEIPKNAVIDRLVRVISLPGDPYHKDGEEFDLAIKTAKLLEERGWVKIK